MRSSHRRTAAGALHHLVGIDVLTAFELFDADTPVPQTEYTGSVLET
jgi:hypothetical protein